MRSFTYYPPGEPDPVTVQAVTDDTHYSAGDFAHLSVSVALTFDGVGWNVGQVYAASGTAAYDYIAFYPVPLSAVAQGGYTDNGMRPDDWFYPGLNNVVAAMPARIDAYWDADLERWRLCVSNLPWWHVGEVEWLEDELTTTLGTLGGSHFEYLNQERDDGLGGTEWFQSNSVQVQFLGGFSSPTLTAPLAVGVPCISSDRDPTTDWEGTWSGAYADLGALDAPAVLLPEWRSFDYPNDAEVLPDVEPLPESRQEEFHTTWDQGVAAWKDKLAFAQTLSQAGTSADPLDNAPPVFSYTMPSPFGDLLIELDFAQPALATVATGFRIVIVGSFVMAMLLLIMRTIRGL